MADETMIGQGSGSGETGRDVATVKTLRENATRATERAHQMADRVGAGLHIAVDSVGHSAERAISQGDALTAAARGYVRARPLVSLGAAFALGFMLSRLMR
jgi:ElaB/YqjD/DUF883 family membrane-anchored ribosome-binding protein